MEKILIRNNCLWVSLPEELDHHRTKMIRERADEMLLDDRVEHLVVDFSDTAFMDSSGIGFLVGRYKKVASFGGKVYVVNTNERIKNILEASGIMGVIEIINDTLIAEGEVK